MQYALIGIVFICMGLSAFILKKYPTMNNYHSSIKRKYTITNEKNLIFLDGSLYFSSGLILILADMFYSNYSKVYLPLFISLLAIDIILYFVLRKRLLKKIKN